MARKIINIGIAGNDGTGDPIREAFRSVNDNFRELYGALGLGERLQFTNLTDTPDSYNSLDIGYEGGFSNAVVTVSEVGNQLKFRKLIPGDGISLDFQSNPNEITVSSDFRAISADSSPRFGGPVNAQENPIGNLPDIRNPGKVAGSVSSLFQVHNLSPGLENELADSLAANKGYVDTKISRAGTNSIDPATGTPNSLFGRMTGPLILSRDPIEDDDTIFDGLIAATKRYVDNSGFGSSINLFVAKSGLDERPGISPELQGRALSYAYKTIGAAMRKADELIDQAPFELGPYQKVLTFNQGQSQCTLSSIITAPDSGSGFIGTVLLSVDTITINTTGSLYYPGDLLSVIGGSGTPATIRVLSTLATPGPIESIQIVSRGVYSALPANPVLVDVVASGAPQDLQDQPGWNPLGFAASFNLTYRVNSITITNPGSGYGLVSVRITGGGGAGAFGTADIVGGQINSITITNPGSGFTTIPILEVDLPRFLINTGGLRTDFSGTFDDSGNLANARTQDLRPGLFLRGETSGALAQILEYSGELVEGDEIFDVDIKLGSFELGEVIAYGDVSKFIQITIMVESGIYEEHYPIKVPQNVALLGDEFRRVIVRPIKNTISASPWALDRFRRDILLGRQNRPGIEYDQATERWISTGDIEGDLLQIADRLHGYHYLRDSSKPVYNNDDNQIVNRGNYQAAVSLLLLNKLFLQEEVVAWIELQIENANNNQDTNSIWYEFNYDKRQSRQDLGLIIEAVAFDLKLGGYNNTIAAGLRYFESANAQKIITPSLQGGQLEQHIASIRRLNTLTQLVLKNIELETRSQQIIFQTIDPGIVSEMGTVGDQWAISSIKKLNTASIELQDLQDSSTPVTFATGDTVIITQAEGITELNGNKYFVEQISSTTYDLYLDPPGLNARPVIIETDQSHQPETGIVIEPKGIVGKLFAALIDVCEADPNDSESVINFPKNNDELDVFLCNDATILRRVSAQGHGGFMMVLDPVGQILAKSPYAQECASFSRSINEQTFAGGMYVDGFSGNLQFKFLEKVNGSSTRLKVGGLSRFPQLPSSIVVDDQVFRINYVRNFILDPFGDDGTTAELELSINTPFTKEPGSFPCNFTVGNNNIAVIQAVEHGLQPGATVVFTGTLPTGITENTEYYVLEEGLTNNQFTITAIFGTIINVTITATGSAQFQRIYEILMPGNRSMLANDYTQINDMGYGLVTNNGGLLEAVSVFTYYCFISYYSVNGGQIRSIGGSSAHGVYALVAEGFDVLEVPTPTGLFFEKSQTVFSVTENEFVTDKLVVYIRGWDYLPLPGSEVEINHSGIVVRYPVTTVTREEVNPNIARLDIRGTAGLGETESQGLIDTVVNGTPLTVRMNTTVILTGNVADVPTRPSTGLKLFEQPDRVYRVLRFEQYQDSEAPFEIDITPGTPGVFAAVSTIVEINNNVCTTLKNHRLKPGDRFIPLQSGNGLTGNVEYTVSTVPAYNKFTLTGTVLINGTALSIRGKKTHGFRENFRISFSNDNTLPEGLNDQLTYFIISDNLTPTEFRISTTLNGEALAITSSGQGNTVYRIEGLVQTILRESYDYVNLTVYEPGEFTSDPLKPVVITIGSPTLFTSNNHGLLVGDVIRFISSDPNGMPLGLSSRRNYFVISTDFTANQFRVSSRLGGSSLSTSGTQSGTFEVGKVTGRAGDATFAVVPVASGTIDPESESTIIPSPQEQRVPGSSFILLGKTYTIVDYEDTSSTLQEFARITLDRPLEDPINQFDGVYAIKSALSPRDDKTQGTLTIRISLVRVTGHDLLDIGTGSYADTNYPNEIYGPPVNTRDATKETQERDVGRVFYVTTDQFGNFNVGPFFNVDQGTGEVTFSTSIAFTNLTGLGFKRGVRVSEFSTDTSMVRNSQDTVPTEVAVRGYVDRRLGVSHTGATVADNQLIPPTVGGFMPLSGALGMKGNLNLNNNRILNVNDPELAKDAVNKQWVKMANLQDVTLTPASPNNQNLLMFTGTSSNLVNVGNNTLDIDNTVNSSGGGSDVTLIRSDNTVTIKLVGGNGNKNPITNYHINDNANIQQSKLEMQLSSTRALAPTGTNKDKQAASGLSSFKDTEFAATDGFIQLLTATSTSTGINLGKIQWIPSNNVLGNSTGLPDAVTAVPFSSVVDIGGAVKKSQYSSVGFLRRSNFNDNTLDSSYGIVDMSTGFPIYTADDNNQLIQRNANGNFGANIVRLSSLEIDLQNTLQTNRTVLNAQVVATGGIIRLLGWNGVGGIFIGGGSQVSDRITNYNNDQHQFRTADGSADAPVRASSVRTLALTSGNASTTGSITGDWSLTGTSRLQATYSADIAEYYQGDQVYTPGTVLIFGGTHEVTACEQHTDTRVAGVVSDNAAFVMYDACPGHKNLIALQGRVQCRVVGKITKGSLLVTSKIKGVAVAATADVKVGSVIGKALENYESDHIGTIEVSVGRT